MRRERWEFFSFPVAQDRGMRKPESADDRQHDFLSRHATDLQEAACTAGPHRSQSPRLAGWRLAAAKSAKPHQAAGNGHAGKVGVQKLFPYALWRCRNAYGIRGLYVIRRHELFEFHDPSVYRRGPDLAVHAPEQGASPDKPSVRA